MPWRRSADAGFVSRSPSKGLQGYGLIWIGQIFPDRMPVFPWEVSLTALSNPAIGKKYNGGDADFIAHGKDSRARAVYRTTGILVYSVNFW
jgi:hypothetical protein